MKERSIHELVIGSCLLVGAIVIPFMYPVGSRAVETAGEVGRPVRALDRSYALSGRDGARTVVGDPLDGRGSGVARGDSYPGVVVGTSEAVPTTTKPIDTPEPSEAALRERALVAAITEAFPPAEWQRAFDVAWRESRYDHTQRIIDVNGEWSVGLFQVQPRWWGEVPADAAGQARMAATIVLFHGWEPWR